MLYKIIIIVLLSAAITVERSKLDSSILKWDNSVVKVWSWLLDSVTIIISGQKLKRNLLLFSKFSPSILRLLIKFLSRFESFSWRVSSNSCSVGKRLKISFYLLSTKFSLIWPDLLSSKKSIWFWSTSFASRLSCLALLRVTTFWAGSTWVFGFEIDSLWSYNFLLLSVILDYSLSIINCL